MGREEYGGAFLQDIDDDGAIAMRTNSIFSQRCCGDSWESPAAMVFIGSFTRELRTTEQFQNRQ